MKHWCVVALLTVVLFRGMPASAQGGPPALPATVTLDEVLKLLEERSPGPPLNGPPSRWRRPIGSPHRPCRIQP